MRLGLADVKKRVVRRQGEAYLEPHLLRRDELRAELGALVGLYEGWLGHERGEFPMDRAAELIGDYRLARGLMTVLSEWYAWEPPSWPGPASAEETQTLAARGIASSGQMRLALYDTVSDQYGGYLPASERESALDSIATGFGVARTVLDSLLALDDETRERLTRATPAAPAPAELAARFNRRAVEALLANAAVVEWLVPPDVAAAQGTSLGTLLKRICFLARRLGVYYDVSFADASSEDSETRANLGRVAEPPALYVVPGGAVRDDAPYEDAQPLDALSRALVVTLYGPQEAFGGPTLYGDRLARLCRMLLGNHHRDSAPLQGAVAPLVLRGHGLRGEARVYLHGHPFRFALDERLLALLELVSDGAADAGAASDTASPHAPGVRTEFDSSLEQWLHEEFASLERSDGAHGWRMDREPEPILCGETILIPDFALTRGSRRVYMEVAGYWSPAYRERKRRKLAALAGRVALVVAAPDTARSEFAGVESDFPLLWYHDRVSAQALVTLLEKHFDDFAARRASVIPTVVLAEVERRGLVPWDECRGALHTYSRGELLLVAEDITQAARADGRDPPRLVEGVGLAAAAWLERAGTTIGRWVDSAGPEGLALGTLASHAGDLDASLALSGPSDSAAEALASATGYEIARASLFEPRVRRTDHSPPHELLVASAEPAAPLPTRPQPRTPSRRRHQQRPSHSPDAPLSLWQSGDTPAG